MGLTVILLCLVPSILHVLMMVGLLKKDRIFLVVPFSLIMFLSVALCWKRNDELLFFLNAANALLIGLGGLIFKCRYNSNDVEVLINENTPDWVTHCILEKILAKKIEKQIEGKVDPRITSRVASSLAAGALSESRASGGGALSVDHLTAQAAGLAGAMSAVDTGSHFSDDLLSRAMSIADHHIAAFDAGHWQTSGPMGMDTNPATGLPMMGGGIDTGGDAFGTSWHHDHSLSSSFDSHYSDPFHDSASGINAGSSFDDFNRY